MSLVAVYPGTFDPITNGHVDILRRALALFDHVVVAVAENLRKVPMFSLEERSQLIRASVGDDPRVEVDSFTGLHMNRHLAPGVETVFLMTSQESFYVSSSLVKEVATMGGDITRIAPPAVVEAFKRKLKDGKQT
jgi:pantetheine-phosphate adenylyltransferase